MTDYPSAKYDVKIYTGNPMDDDSRLLVSATVSGTETITFDMPKNLADVYVRANGDEGYAIDGRALIEDNVVNIGAATTKAATRAVGSCQTTVEWKGTTLNYDYVNNQTRKSITYYKLNNVKTRTGDIHSTADLRKIVGSGQGVFEEGQNNRDKYLTGNNPVLNDDVEYTMTEAGTISLEFVYRCTGTNKYKRSHFGYFYYDKNTTPTKQNIGNIKKYLLIEDTNTNSIIQYNNASNSNNVENFVGSNTANVVNTQNTNVWGTKYDLVYFGMDGDETPTFTFPKDVKIGFFLAMDEKDGTYYDQHCERVFYSIPELNGGYEGRFKDSFNNIMFATYNYNGATYMGVDDWDSDLNDLVFKVTGTFEKPAEIVEEKEDKQIMWTIACEDLGDTDDYDFNDVVFGITNDGDGYVTITPFAAGGVYKATITHNGTSIGEIHELLRATATESGSYPMINTTNYTFIGETKRVYVGNNFSIADNMGGFGIVVDDVTKAHTLEHTITAPQMGAIPQMFVVNGEWKWPRERCSIQKAYLKFSDWVKDAKVDWTNDANNIVTGNVVSR